MAMHETAMQSVDSYLSDVIAMIEPLRPTEIALADADRAVLADDVMTAWPLPGFDGSAMDGYAVRAADVAQASQDSPVELPVDDEVAAGDTRQLALRPGHAIKIMTGALLPEGADAVVPVEWTDGGAQAVLISRPPGTGNAVRHAGDDAKPGDLLLPAGAKLGPAQIGVLAAAGLGVVFARRRPRVTIISTGNELAPPGAPLVPGLIWETNSYLLAAAARQAGCDVTRHPTIRDDADEVLAAIRAAAHTADLLITSGGVSMGGEHDVVKAALSKAAPSKAAPSSAAEPGLGLVTFRKVAMQPGMPQGFGRIGPAQTPIFTLPGNPVSAFVSFHVLVGPALRALQDLKSERVARRRARLAGPVSSPPGKRSFLRGVYNREAGVVTPLTGQGSHHIASLAKANALIVVPEQVTGLPAGELVEIMELP
jgi:molybdopterin molybdotransferase